MKSLSKRFLACFLALTLLMTCVPAMVLAEDQVGVAAEALSATQSRSASAKTSPTVSRSTVSYTVYDVASLQSPHSYPNNADYHYIYSVPSASYLNITFSSSTYVENGSDFISISTGTGQLVGTYTGSALSGKTIRVPSGTVDIRLKTDQSSAYYGFQVTNVTNNLQNQNTLQSRENIGDVNLGKSVIGKVWQTAGRPTSFYIWQVFDSNGGLVYQTNIGGNTSEFTYTPSKSGTYCLAVTGYDGAEYSNTAYSNWFSVYSSQPTTLSVSLDGRYYGYGGKVTITAKQLTGNPILFYHCIIINDTGRRIYEFDSSTPTMTYNAPYYNCTLCAIVQAYDGRAWCSEYSDWFAVSSSTPQPPSQQKTSISVSMSGYSVAVGGSLVGSVRVLSGGPVLTYHYVLQDSSGASNATFDSTNSQVQVTLRIQGTYRLLVQAYDGREWCYAYSDWFSVTGSTTPVQPQTAITASLSASSVNVGQVMTVTARVTSGGPIQFYHFEVQSENGQVLTATDLGINTFTYAPTATGRQRVLVQGYDGKNWCSTYTDWFTVNKAAPQTAITASLSSTTINVGEILTVTARVTSGGPVQYYHYEVLTESGQTLTAVDLGINTFTYAPGTTGKQRVKVQAYDGKVWCETYTGWFTVINSTPTYRALVIGQSYPGEAKPLPGCERDARCMTSMLKTMDATPYQVTQKLNLTDTQILSSIATTFSGATKNDISLFFFSGHGLGIVDDNNNFLPSHPMTGALCGVKDSGYVTAAQLRTALDKIPGKKIVILGSCHSGYMIGKNKGGAAAELTDELAQAYVDSFMNAFLGTNKRASNNLAANDYYVLCAVSAGVEGWSITTSSGISYGLFPYALLNGCGWDEIGNKRLTKLNADSNGDKQLTLTEIYNYVAPRYHNLNVSHGHYDCYMQVYPTTSSFVFFGRK